MTEFQEGQTVYQIIWRSKQPRMAYGKVVCVASGKRMIRKVRMQDGTLDSTACWQATKKMAFCVEINALAMWNWRDKNKESPEVRALSLAKVFLRVWRLYKTMMKHHLV